MLDFSFPWKRFIGITQTKQQLAKQGIERKIDPLFRKI